MHVCTYVCAFDVAWSFLVGGKVPYLSSACMNASVDMYMYVRQNLYSHVHAVQDLSFWGQICVVLCLIHTYAYNQVRIHAFIKQSEPPVYSLPEPTTMAVHTYTHIHKYARIANINTFIMPSEPPYTQNHAVHSYIHTHVTYTQIPL